MTISTQGSTVERRLVPTTAKIYDSGAPRGWIWFAILCECGKRLAQDQIECSDCGRKYSFQPFDEPMLQRVEP